MRSVVIQNVQWIAKMVRRELSSNVAAAVILCIIQFKWISVCAMPAGSAGLAATFASVG